MQKRSVTIAGHTTSVSLEDAFWHQLKCIAYQRSVSVNQLIAQIDTNRNTQNLSSAIRLYILEQLLAQIDNGHSKAI